MVFLRFIIFAGNPQFGQKKVDPIINTPKLSNLYHASHFYSLAAFRFQCFVYSSVLRSTAGAWELKECLHHVPRKCYDDADTHQAAQMVNTTVTYVSWIIISHSVKRIFNVHICVACAQINRLESRTLFGKSFQQILYISNDFHAEIFS